MIRLVALDIDGTLLDSQGQLPAENVTAIARAIEAGVHVALATGRRYDFARPVFEQLPGPLTLILSNGAVVKTRDGETLFRHLLPRAIARHVLASAPAHRHSAALTFDRPREAQIVYETIDWDHPKHKRFFEMSRPFLAQVSPLEDALTEDPVQVMFTGGCGEMRELYRALKRAGAEGAEGAGGAEGAVRGAGAGAGAQGAGAQSGRKAAMQVNDDVGEFSVALTEYEHRDFSLVDILRAGVSKGFALRELARGAGIPREAIMAVGDNLNDLEMLEFAGRPVLMDNALPELKGRGWAVTRSNDDAGVARAIETFVLVPAS